MRRSRSASSPGRTLVANVMVLVAATVLALGAAELLARAVLPYDGYHRIVPLQPHQHRDVELVGRWCGHYTTNRLGLRGDEPPADWASAYTIVAIGGSTTHCALLDDRKTWPYVLQTELRRDVPDVWVGNGGIDGHSSRSHVLFVREVIPKIRPDAIVLLVGGNDMLNSLLGYTQVLNPWEWSRRPNLLFDHSRLARQAYMVSQGWRKETPGLQYGIPGKPLPRLEHPTPLPERLDGMLPTLPEYRDNLRAIARAGRAMGIRVVFLTQPVLFENTDRWRDVEGSATWGGKKRPQLSAAAVWRLLDAFNAALLETCRDEGVECFDLASAVPPSEPYFYDWIHFSEDGARLVGEQVAAFLRDSVRIAVARKAR